VNLGLACPAPSLFLYRTTCLCHPVCHPYLVFAVAGRVGESRIESAVNDGLAAAAAARSNWSWRMGLQILMIVVVDDVVANDDATRPCS
jgi:hypothetical protein